MRGDADHQAAAEHASEHPLARAGHRPGTWPPELVIAAVSVGLDGWRLLRGTAGRKAGEAGLIGDAFTR